MARKKLKIPEGVNADLYKEYITLAGRADKRLVRLEKLTGQNTDTYGNVKAYAYRVAQKAIAHWDTLGKEGKKPRFERNHPKSDLELKMKIKDIQNFLELPTSTKEGIKAVYEKRAKKLNEVFDTDFTWEEWARFGSRGYWERKDRKFTYNEMIKIAKTQKKYKDFESKTVKALKKSNVNRNTINTSSLSDIKRMIKNIDKELGISGVLSADRKLIENTFNTHFIDDKGIVAKKVSEYMKDSGLSYETMFK